jgi:hypothetical protein
MPAPDHWTGYVGAVGPLVAAATALWIAGSVRRRERAQRPRLSMLYEHHRGDDFHPGVDLGGNRLGHWVRVRVANERGRRAAEDVEVLVVGLRTPGGPRRLNGYPFLWSNSPERATRLTIPPGVARSFDLMSICEPLISDGGGGQVPGGVPGESECHAELQLRNLPHGLSNAIGAGSHKLEIVVAARNADAVHYSIDLDYDGKWWPEPEIRDHLRVGTPRIVSQP